MYWAGRFFPMRRYLSGLLFRRSSMAPPQVYTPMISSFSSKFFTGSPPHSQSPTAPRSLLVKHGLNQPNVRDGFQRKLELDTLKVTPFGNVGRFL